MKKMNLQKGILLLTLFVVSNTNIFAQKISEAFCDEIFVKIVKPMNPVQIDENETYSNFCNFEFVIKQNRDVSIEVKNHESIKEAKVKLSNMLSLFKTHDKLNNFKRGKIDLGANQLIAARFWDDIQMYENKRTISYALLRKKKFVVTLFAQDSQEIVYLENKLRHLFQKKC